MERYHINKLLWSKCLHNSSKTNENITTKTIILLRQSKLQYCQNGLGQAIQKSNYEIQNNITTTTVRWKTVFDWYYETALICYFIPQQLSVTTVWRQAYAFDLEILLSQLNLKCYQHVLKIQWGVWSIMWGNSFKYI